MQKINSIKHALLGVNIQKDENKIIIDNLTAEIDKLRKELSQKKQVIEELTDPEKSESKQRKKREPKAGTPIENYAFKNLQNFLNSDTGEELLKNPEIFEYDENLTAFDKNLAKNPNYFYKYQKTFIEDWSVSAQELVILYYGVGTGKSRIAVNCAEQFTSLNPNSYVYILSPASLVFNLIDEMMGRGIDPRRKHNNEYVYNFITYQQLLRSEFNFKPNSLLIVDEIHNLRNFHSSQIKEKKSARQWVSTGTYSLVGNKLAIALQQLQQSGQKFLRSIFMTGTLFINNITDIEPIISLGYGKAPLNNENINQLSLINQSEERMKIYYNGLISFYRKPTDTPNFPSVKYQFVGLEGKGKEAVANNDSFFFQTRNEYNENKSKWVVDFCKKHINEKTLIYAQFKDLSVSKIENGLTKAGIKFGIITGELTKIQKQVVKNLYNNNQIKVLIFTLSIKEGISFKETNNFIYTAPYWNYAITEQIIARAIRSDSHKNGNKSVVDVYMLFIKSQNDDINKQFITFCDNVMNKDIKSYFPEITGQSIDEKTGIITQRTVITDLLMKPMTRDMILYLKMIEKQQWINNFEYVLLNKVSSFEKSNNLENNEFIQEYNDTILEMERKGKQLNNKDKIKIKKEMYAKYYTREIEKVNKRIIRLDKDAKFRTNRNPDLELRAIDTKYSNKISEIKKALENGKTLAEILGLYDLPKEEITAFQANFTPENEVEAIIEASGLANDKREKIMILEPTMGIGNVINGALKLPNKQNFFIDGVEIHNLFYQIAMAQFDKIDNVRLYNISILDYQQKYGYDYILGNPPFNIFTQREFFEKGKIFKKDVHLYDVNFVVDCYNKLNDNGILCMIISDRFLRDTKITDFAQFRLWVESMQRIDKNSVNYTTVGSFKKDKTISKKMETDFPMIIIKMIKLPNFNIKLNGTPPNLDEKGIEKYIELNKAEKKQKKAAKKPIEKVAEKPIEQEPEKQIISKYNVELPEINLQKKKGFKIDDDRKPEFILTRLLGDMMALKDKNFVERGPLDTKISDTYYSMLANLNKLNGIKSSSRKQDVIDFYNKVKKDPVFLTRVQQIQNNER